MSFRAPTGPKTSDQPPNNLPTTTHSNPPLQVAISFRAPTGPTDSELCGMRVEGAVAAHYNLVGGGQGRRERRGDLMVLWWMVL
jgi:hypothetical protein